MPYDIYMYICNVYVHIVWYKATLWSGIGSVRTIEWGNSGDNGQTDWGVQINYMVDDTCRSSLTDVCSNTYNTIQILAKLFAA